ncbi:MAG TPA: hypothetical protein VMR06_00145 [Dokdonella sp.]|uniref:hypothetical protein n=1 Tax=Dokdonella sp. TaxID=2291710 RepID=UPI002B8938AA|nr:hypothetical protein [Dokdonella sp.]HUD40391.1 hypothetical protein [Dokdonella sp.]
MNARVSWMAIGTVIGLLAGHTVAAFETETHGLITYNAYKRSVIADDGVGSIRWILGLDRLPVAQPFASHWSPSVTTAYFDNVPVSQPYAYPPIYPSVVDYVRLPHRYESCQIETLQSVGWFGREPALDNVAGSLSIQNWLIRGAIREDDLWPLMYGTKPGCNVIWPDGDPHGWLMRVFNHFYDPVHDRSLANGDLSESKSVNWALGQQDSFAASSSPDSTRRNHFSYADARQNMWFALTDQRGTASLPYTTAAREADARNRLHRWATVFRSLGDVVHLLQDGAQPQHVRIDPHSLVNSSAQKAYEYYTNLRVTRADDDEPPVLKNSYLSGFFHLDEDTAPRQLELGTYATPMFLTPLRFFSTRQQSDGPEASTLSRHGLMDYTNRGFFTAGTLPHASGNLFDQPPTPVDETEGYTRSVVPCRLSAPLAARLVANCVHWVRAVPDTVSPAYTDTMPKAGDGSSFEAPPLLTESAFNAIAPLTGVPLPPRYAIGLEELEAMGNLGVPRAIAYSAGLIDFFFRGQLTLSAPPDGLFGVLDQGKPHTVVDGVPIQADASDRTFGFTAIRVRARNSTGDANGRLTESGSGRVVAQTMKGGSDGNGNATGMLVAIARYHRNPCYQNDLSGEYVVRLNPDFTPQEPFVPSGCLPEQTRSNVPEISVSKPLYIDAYGGLPGPLPGATNACANVGNINTGAAGDCEHDSALLEFDFGDDPIPVNATDLFLQVAYRGQLGEEHDGIAVGAMDLVEPQFFTSWNHTDWYLYEDQWLRPENVPEPPGPDGAEAVALEDLSICFGRQLIGHLPLPAQLAPAEFVRVAFLTDREEVALGTVATYADGPTVARAAAQPLTFPRQSDQEYGGNFESTPWYYGRGTTLGLDLTLYFQYFTGSWWLFNFPEAAALTPPLGSASTPGIPKPLTASFSGVPHPLCETHFAEPSAAKADGSSRSTLPTGHSQRASGPEPEGSSG